MSLGLRYTHSLAGLMCCYELFLFCVLDELRGCDCALIYLAKSTLEIPEGVGIARLIWVVEVATSSSQPACSHLFESGWYFSSHYLYLIGAYLVCVPVRRPGCAVWLCQVHDTQAKYRLAIFWLTMCSSVVYLPYTAVSQASAPWTVGL